MQQYGRNSPMVPPKLMRLLRQPTQGDLWLARQRKKARIQTQARNENQLAPAVEERAGTFPLRNRSRLILLLQTARRPADSGLELLASNTIPDVELGQIGRAHV